MRIWFKLFDDTAHLIKDETIDNYEDDTRTHKVFKALEEACILLDLSQPVWLDKNVAEFQRSSKTRFTRDNFIEEIEFDYMEMHVIEED